MPISPTDLKFYLATTAGSAGFTTAQGNHNSSLGKYISTTPLVNASLNNLFDSISASENAANDVEYRLLFILNDNPTLTLSLVSAYLYSEYVGGASAAISIDTTGVTPKGQAGIQAKTINTENEAPATQTFSAPVTRVGGLPIADLGPGQVQGIWVRRTGANSIPMALDGVRLRVEGDTPA